MSVTRRMMAVAGGGGTFAGAGETASLPSSWNITRNIGNPVIVTAFLETHEMYNPAPLRLTSGDIWCYVKGTARIYAWKSTDNGVTFALQNSANQVVGPGTSGQWDDGFVVEPTVLYDQPNGTIHLWYKGYAAGAVNPGWGHATAPDSNPVNFTKDPANPILTATSAASQLGGGTVTDLSTGSVIKIGSTTHFYGYAQHNGVYKLVHATGSGWNDPGVLTTVLSATGGAQTIVETPDVIRIPGGGSAVYAMLYSQGGDQPAPRSVRVGSSPDGTTWDFSDTTDILSRTGSGWEKDEAYSGHFIKETSDPWSRPYEDGSGRWLYYYSGLNVNVAQSGLAYMDPS